MTARINRNTPLVEPNTGVPTLYGWSILQSVWRATGGEQAVDGTELKARVLEMPRELSEDDLEPTAPPPADMPTSEELEPTTPVAASPETIHNLTVTGEFQHVGDKATFEGTLAHEGSALGFFSASPVAQQTAPASLTDNTGGTTNDTLAAVGDTSTTDQSGPINDNFAELAEDIAAIRTALINLGLIT